jgi:hypothetical protein
MSLEKNEKFQTKKFEKIKGLSKNELIFNFQNFKAKIKNNY